MLHRRSEDRRISTFRSSWPHSAESSGSCRDLVAARARLASRRRSAACWSWPTRPPTGTRSRGTRKPAQWRSRLPREPSGRGYASRSATSGRVWFVADQGGGADPESAPRPGAGIESIGGPERQATRSSPWGHVRIHVSGRPTGSAPPATRSTLVWPMRRGRWSVGATDVPPGLQTRRILRLSVTAMTKAPEQRRDGCDPVESCGYVQSHLGPAYEGRWPRRRDNIGVADGRMAFTRTYAGPIWILAYRSQHDKSAGSVGTCCTRSSPAVSSAVSAGRGRPATRTTLVWPMRRGRWSWRWRQHRRDR